MARKIDLVRHLCTPRIHFLPEALDHAPPHDPEEPDEEEPSGWEDGSLTPFMSYRKVPQPNDIYNEWSDVYRHLRRLGYVFWDSSRLEDEFVRQKLRSAASCEGENEARSDMLVECSAASILAQIMVPKYVMGRLFKKYGRSCDY